MNATIIYFSEKDLENYKNQDKSLIVIHNSKSNNPLKNSKKDIENITNEISLYKNQLQIIIDKLKIAARTIKTMKL